jgi:hypothetical protein
MEILTDSIQDYLKIIYELTAEGGPAGRRARLGDCHGAAPGRTRAGAGGLP